MVILLGMNALLIYISYAAFLADRMLRYTNFHDRGGEKRV